MRSFALKRVLCTQSHLRLTERQWKRVIWSDESTFQLVFGKNGNRIIHAKDEKDHSDCFQRKVQKTASVLVSGCISGHGMDYLHICDTEPNDAKAYVGIFERHMLLSRQWLFPGTPCLFQQDNARPHSARVTTACLRRHRVRMLDWPACSPDLSPIENVWRILKRRIRHLLPRPVEQSCIHQEWAKDVTCKPTTIDIFSSQTITKSN